MRAFTPWCLALLCVSFCCGCGGARGSVAGKITEEGKPIGGVYIIFQSLDDQEAQPVGASTNAEGDIQPEYRPNQKKGLPPGRYMITVERHVQKNGQPLPEGEEGDAMIANEQAVKQSYDFEEEIAAGENTLNLKLSEEKLRK